jgi:hypothetical protein
MLTYADGTFISQEYLNAKAINAFPKYMIFSFSSPPPLQQCLTPFQHTPKTNNYGASSVQGRSTVRGFTMICNAIER